MVRLLGRAARETGDWTALREAADESMAGMTATTRPRHHQERFEAILLALGDYADREGAPPHELVRIFGVEEDAPQPEAYAAAVMAAREQERFRRHPNSLPRHCFALAVVFLQDGEAIRIFE